MITEEGAKIMKMLKFISETKNLFKQFDEKKLFPEDQRSKEEISEILEDEQVFLKLNRVFSIH